MIKPEQGDPPDGTIRGRYRYHAPHRAWYLHPSPWGTVAHVYDGWHDARGRPCSCHGETISYDVEGPP